MSDQGDDRQIFGGRYELQRHIARGGMAEVYLARDVMLDRPIALKVLFPELTTDRSFVERFRREAQAAANWATRTSSRSTTTARRTGTPSSSWSSWTAGR